MSTHYARSLIRMKHEWRGALPVSFDSEVARPIPLLFGRPRRFVGFYIL